MSGKSVHVGGVYGFGSPNYLTGVQEMASWGNYLFISALEDGRVTIFDVEDKESNPKYVSSIPVEAGPRKLSVSKDGNWLFLGNTKSIYYGSVGSGNFMIINVEDKENPVIESVLVIDPDGIICGSSYVDSKEVCYIVGHNESLMYSIDVSDKTNPSIISSVSAGKNPHGVWANEKVAFVLGHFDDKVHTFDVSDPSNMIYLDSYQSSDLRRNSQLCGKYWPNIYVGSLHSSASIFNISDPKKIKRLSAIDFPSMYTCSVTPNSKETVMYVTTAPYGYETSKPLGTLRAYDIIDKSNPALIDEISNSEAVPLSRPTAGSLSVISNYIYVGLWEGNGVSVFKFD